MSADKKESVKEPKEGSLFAQAAAIVLLVGFVIVISKLLLSFFGEENGRYAIILFLALMYVLFTRK